MMQQDEKTSEDQVDESVEFTDQPEQEEIDFPESEFFSSAVLHATDWTTETIISQLKRGNMLLNPSFQRRDAWSKKQKSRFIESLILGLPIPQIVLAEAKGKKGKYIVLDGKQRLLSLLQFWGLGEGQKNEYSLSGLEIRKELSRKKYKDLETNPNLEDDLNSLLNQPIRTVVIRNWPSIDFLHLVFLRLNTGSVKLSPQELRQALFPGEFSTWIDEAASSSKNLQHLLRLKEPDYRMRDVEILSRFLAFRFFFNQYQGRMKKFLDFTFENLNKKWDSDSSEIREGVKQLESGIDALETILGPNLARKPGARQFNRAIFDVLAFYAADPEIRNKMLENKERVNEEYIRMFDDAEFRSSIERDTAGVPNTVLRFRKWAESLERITGKEVEKPSISEAGGIQTVAL